MKTARYFILFSIVFFVLFTCGCKDTSSEYSMPYDTQISTTPTIEVENDQQVSIISPESPDFPGNIGIDADGILGEYHTLYGTSTTARKNNIKAAAKKINGLIMYPNEEFSACDYLTPFTIENGYELASGFANGRIVDSIGGGVCQVTSTLYNAVLEAELEVLERHPHSMTVSYIELGRDAAIAENLKNFRFINSMETPIVIEAYTVDDYQLVIRIRGIENRVEKNREIYFETIIIEEVEPGEPVIEYDETQTKDYMRITQSARKGYRVELYKVIKNSDAKTERIKINVSEYTPIPQYMTIGVKE